MNKSNNWKTDRYVKSISKDEYYVLLVKSCIILISESTKTAFVFELFEQ